MTLIRRGPNGNGYALPDPAQIRDVGQTAAENVVTNAAIQESVQEFPPPINTGAFFAQTVRGPLLEPFGTKARDKQLRLIFRNEYNNLVQGTVSSMIKKVVTTPWEIHGDKKELFYIPNSLGQMRSIEAVEHYQLLLQNAQFGMGWEFFLSRLLEDFFTQDFGGVVELAGLGEPIGPIEGPVMSVAQLDAGRCYVTGNPYYPILYISLISGSLHRMHASRIIRFVDQPSPAEEFFGIGLSALSRVISVANRQMLMNQYIQQQVDDRPKPGIMTTQGMTTAQRNKILTEYGREQQNDARPFWGRTIWFDSVNMDNPIKVESTPFAEVPENFDWEKYNKIDVNAVALAFNTDIQEIWELQGSALGSGQQSTILHQKSQAKMFGYILQNVERWTNRRVLRPEFQFEFKYQDPQQDQLKAQTDFQLAQTVAALANIGVITPEEGRAYLASQSQDFKDALSSQSGQVVAPDAATEATTQTTLDDDNPIDVSAQPAMQQQKPAEPKAEPPKPQSKAHKHVGFKSFDEFHTELRHSLKAYSITSADFERQFAGAFNRAQGAQMPRSQFEGLLLGFLSANGPKAYEDGLKQGGVVRPLDDDDDTVIQNWLVNQIDYIDGLSNELYGPQFNLSTARVHAMMWVNKSLGEMFEAGRLHADADGMYIFEGDDGLENCPECARYKGQVHRMADWHEHRAVPKIYTDGFTCKGFWCKHKLVKTKEFEKGNW